MLDLDHWQEIANALRRNKVRTALTAFGVFWGIFMLMLMLGSGSGLENGVSQGFAGSATNSFFVWSQRTSKPFRGLPSGRSPQMTNEDTLALRAHIADAAIVAPRNQLGGFRGGNNVTRGTKAGAFGVMGDVPEARIIEAVHLTAGRFVNNLDIEGQRKIAVIGSRVRELLFESDEDPVGLNIRINGVDFKVVGLFSSRQSGDQGEREASKIYVPFTTFQNAFNYGNRVGWFAVTSVDGVPASVVEKQVIDHLKTRHRVAPDDQRAFGSWNTEEEYNQVQGLFLGIRALVWIVGIGTLAAGVIGVSNIMLVIVKERTKEIGVRRALGATPLNITSEILFEAVVLTLVAGYVGLIAGMWVVDGARAALAASGGTAEMFTNPDVGVGSALRALAILIVSGALAGLLPAMMAIRISPVEALRSE